MTKINETKVVRRENRRELMTERGDPLAVALGCAACDPLATSPRVAAGAATKCEKPAGSGLFHVRGLTVYAPNRCEISASFTSRTCVSCAVFSMTAHAI